MARRHLADRRTDSRGFALASVFSAVVGLFIAGLFLGPVAVLTGWFALRRGTAPRFRAAAVAGVVLGLVAFAAALLFTLASPTWYHTPG